MATLNEKGQEVLDPTPLSIPFGFQRPPTLEERIMRLMRSEFDRRMAVASSEDDIETPEEADDFDIGDDFDPSSPYENDFMPDVAPDTPLTSDPEFNQKQDNKSSDDAEASKESTSDE